MRERRRRMARLPQGGVRSPTRRAGVIVLRAATTVRREWCNLPMNTHALTKNQTDFGNALAINNVTLP
jgi:hypothetical protein